MAYISVVSGQLCVIPSRLRRIRMLVAFTPFRMIIEYPL